MFSLSESRKMANALHPNTHTHIHPLVLDPEIQRFADERTVDLNSAIHRLLGLRLLSSDSSIYCIDC